jgi:hypothetical protein
METSLHRQLKSHYAPEASSTEVTLGPFRIDVVRSGELIEIQHGSLAAIRDKVLALTKQYQVRVVKPIVVSKCLVKRAARGRRVIDRRMSPKRGSILDLFHEMVYFCRVFPRPNLTLEVPLVSVEEWRYPGHGRRRWRRPRDFRVEDQKLLEVQTTYEFHTAADLAGLLPLDVPVPFGTAHLAHALRIDVGFAQRIAYSLRQTGAIQQVGKAGNALLYARCAG